MVDRILIRTKLAGMERSLGRLREKKKLTLAKFKDDMDSQDVVLHNLQLAIQSCIDIGGHIISDLNWGVPSTLGGIFQVLARHRVISPDFAEVMEEMVGFRNILIHEYEAVDIRKVYNILKNHLVDFDTFRRQVIKFLKLKK